MKRGCLGNILFAGLLLVAFGGSSYFWFNFFVRGTSLPTPNLIGKSVAQANAICSDLGLALQVDYKVRRNSDRIPAGHIAWQNRNAGTTSFVKRGATIRVELSAGPLVLRVPDLDGQSPGTAVLRLSQQNLKLGNLAYTESGSQGIIAAHPSEGTVVSTQAAISFLVGVPRRPMAYVMPDLIDHSLDQVRLPLERRGLRITTVKYEAYPGLSDGIIIRQFPLRGAPVGPGDPISLVVSKQEETSVMDAVGAFGGQIPAPADTSTQ